MVSRGASTVLRVPPGMCGACASQKETQRVKEPEEIPTRMSAAPPLFPLPRASSLLYTSSYGVRRVLLHRVRWC